MSERFGDSGLEADIERAMRGEPLDIMSHFLQAELVVPSGGLVEERFKGFVPLLYDRDGVPMLAIYTSSELARATADLAPYAITMLGNDVIKRMPEAYGFVVNPGHAIGFEVLPDGVKRVKADLDSRPILIRNDSPENRSAEDQIASEDERTPLEDLVARVGEDWIDPCEVIYLAHRYGVEDVELRRDTAIGLIARAMWLGLIIPGQITDSGFEPWASSVAESMWRIAAEWCARRSPLVGPGEIAWFAATPKGEAMARDIWKREGLV